MNFRRGDTEGRQYRSGRFCRHPVPDVFQYAHVFGMKQTRRPAGNVGVVSSMQDRQRSRSSKGLQ